MQKELPFQLPPSYVEALQERQAVVSAIRKTLRKPEVDATARAQFVAWMEGQFTVTGSVFVFFY